MLVEPGNICDSCGYKYALNNANSVVYYYECQPWFSFAATICPNCQSSARLFFPEQHNDYMACFIIGDFGFITEDFAPEGLVTEYERVFQLHLIIEQALTPRLEVEIDELGIWLATAPDEWIMAMFEEPAPPKERPDTWVDPK